MGKLLIVDDENEVCEYTKRFFLRFQINVLVATSGKEALELIAKEMPDLILLDLSMMNVSGIDVLKQIKKRGVPAKVIVVSAISDRDVIEATKELGAVEFIHKPYLLEELEMTVLKALSIETV